MSITAANVTKRFGSFVALDDVTVECPAGELVALLGPSGSGKTTLLRIIAGLEAADAGTVRHKDDDITHRSAKDRHVGFVFQHYALFRHMTVFENVAFGLRVRHAPEAEVRHRVMELLKLVRLEEKAERYPAALSGGQKQRIALARALAPEPKVLLLDEPFGALDATVRAELRDWLRVLHHEIHVTTVLVTHDREEAMDVADRIVVMQGGRIVQEGSPTEVYDHPATAFVMGFVGPVARLGDALVRPHDLVLDSEPEEGGREGMIERIAPLGFEVRVELLLTDGERIRVQLTRDEAAALDLHEGAIVGVRASAEHRFGEAPTA